MKFYLTIALTAVLAVSPLCAVAESSEDSSGATYRGKGRRAQQQHQELAIAHSATITTTRVSTFNT